MSGDDPFKGLKPGETRSEGPVFIGAMPVRMELEVLPPSDDPSIGAKEWAEFGNCLVYVFNGGPLNANWTLAEGGNVLVRTTKPGGGWWISELLKDQGGWYVMCDDTRVPIVWSDKRACWVSTVEV